MSSNQSSQEVLEREFLPVRAKILEIAAALDRIDRADESGGDSKQAEQLCEGIKLLLLEVPNRAERVQQLFSLAYEESWREKFDVAHSSACKSGD